MQHFRTARLLFGLATAILVAACGGGNGGGVDTPEPSGLGYPTAPSFVVGHAISILSPTVTGMVTAYSVSPQLPAGLSLSASTGVISGTPTAVTSATSYTVAASNAGGSTTATITLTVNDALPVISYGGTNFAFTKQGTVHLIPTNSGGAVVTWSISGDLPAGLTFTSADGSIAGTPTAAAAAKNYVVTAQNSGGQTAVSLTLAVQTVLLNLGSSGGINRIRLGNSRVLSLGDGGSWALWDAGTAALVASGTPHCLQPPTHVDPTCHTAPLADMAGSIVVIEINGAFEMRSASDGSLIATLTVPTTLAWWRLASDGSYLCAGGPGGLTVWSPTGTVVLSRAGDYSTAIAFAAPGAVQVGLGQAGTSVIETISVPSGSSSTGPAFQGQFNSWFQEGSQFLTNIGNTVWVYSAGGTQEDIRVLPTITSLTGQGSWFWTYDGTSVSVYKVGASATPAGTFSVGFLNYTSPIPSGTTIGALQQALVGSPISVVGVVHVIDLSGPSPVMVDHTTPAYDNTAYAATSSSQWLVGNADGTLLDGTSLGSTLRYFGYGHALSIAGSAQRVAVSTAVGKILFFNVATNALEGTVDSPGSPGYPGSQIALSADGSVLVAGSTGVAAGSAGGAGALQVYSLPSGTLTYSWPPAIFLSFVLSDSGTVLGQILGATREVTATTGGAVIWSDTTNQNTVQPIRLSPDGTLIAVSSSPIGTVTTDIYRNGALVTAIPGWAVCWLDNTHLLVQNSGGTTGYGPGAVYTSSVIVDPQGLTLSTPAPHNFEDPFQVVGPDSIYVLQQNSILSVSTGATTWSTVTPSLGVGAVAGSYVVFVSGNQVISQPM